MLHVRRLPPKMKHECFFFFFSIFFLLLFLIFLLVLLVLRIFRYGDLQIPFAVEDAWLRVRDDDEPQNWLLVSYDKQDKCKVGIHWSTGISSDQQG